MRRINHLTSLIGATVIASAIAAVILGSQSNSSSIHPRAVANMSSAEILARSTIARGDLRRAVVAAPFRARVPTADPTGYQLLLVNWEPGRPDRGFAVWFVSDDQQHYTLHLLEAPEVPGARKDVLKEPTLQAVRLSNGDWHSMQKPTQPWQGLWIYAIVLDGVHVEIDGSDRQAVENLAGSL